MYDIETLKEWLFQYREAERDIINQTGRLERLQVRIEGLGAMNITDDPRSPSPVADRLGDLIDQKIELENQIEAIREGQKIARSRMEYVLSQIRDSYERMVIRERYQDCEDWEDIAYHMYGRKSDYADKTDSYQRRMFRKHGDALYDMIRYFSESRDPEVEWYKAVSRDIRERRKRHPVRKQRPQPNVTKL